MTNVDQNLAGLSPDQRRLVELWLRSQAAPAAPPLAPGGIPRRAAGARCPLAFAQQPIWFLHQWDPSSAAYAFPIAVRLRGPCDAATLTRCLDLIVRRHEALRATFCAVDGAIEQAFAPPAPLPVARVDLGRIPPDMQDPLVQRLALAVATQPFDLERGPLLRACILRLAPQLHVLLVAVHHIVFDDWSQGVLLRELAALYAALSAGQRSPLPDLPIQYGDYALWQRRIASGSAMADQLAFWTAQLRDAPALLDLPTDYPRPAMRSAQGASYTFIFPPALAEDLAALSRRSGATLFMILLAAFNVLLARSSGQNDIVIGAPVAGRTREDLEGLIGLFMNLLALRTDLRGNPTAWELLARVRRVTLAAYAHQQVMFDQILDALQIARDPSRYPLFQVLLSLQNAPMPSLKRAGLAIEPLETDRGAARWDLALFVREEARGLRGRLEYRTDLFAAATIRRMAGQLLTLLEGMAADPQRPIARLPLLTPAERRQILEAWNATATDYPVDISLADLVAAQAARTPDAVAAACGSACLSYAALVRRADQLARALRAKGVGPGARVGICLERSLDLVVALLGVAALGAAYAPLDPSYPPARLAHMIADAGIAALLTDAARDALVAQIAQSHPGALPPTRLRLDADWPLIAGATAPLPPNRAGTDGLLYLIYTSGSTGRPKGAAVYQRGFLNLLHWFIRDFALDSGDRALVIASFSFDLTQKDLFAPLISGGQLHLLDAAYDPALIRRRISERRISWVNCTPSAFYPLAEAGDAAALASLRYVFLGGEPIAADRLAGWAASERCRAQVVNTYGPTECTDVTASYPIARLADWTIEPPPLGRPIGNTQLLILDRARELAPVGVAGELCVGGAGVGLGYLNDPALTAERFIPNPFASVGSRQSAVSSWQGSHDRRLLPADCRLYKTGDLARWRPDGLITYLGRIDAQIKLRGYRIELDEIASALRSRPDVRDAVAVLRADAPGDQRLVAYVVPSIEDGDANTQAALSSIFYPLSAELRAFLAARLPEYMIPAAFVALAALPLTPNGKLDRRALPAPDAAAFGAAPPFRAPRDAVEELLAGVWGEVLGRAQVGIDDNFFTLGGHSLLATQVVARVRQVFGVDLPLRALFERPTVAGLAAALGQARQSGALAQLPPLQPQERPADLPLSFAQQRLWFIDQLAPGATAYTIPFAVRLRGRLDLAALRRSLNQTIARHESLRTTFALEGEQPVQRIASPAPRALPLLDLRALDLARRAALAEHLRAALIDQPFDLERGPLLRVVVLRLDGATHQLLLTMHHIISDGWSVDVLVRELTEGYRAAAQRRRADLPALPVQYADYALWQQRWMADAALGEQLRYWRAHLAGAPPDLALPLDRPRPPIQTFAGATQIQQEPPELIAALRALSRRAGATLFMTLLAAFHALLARLSGQSDVVVGSPIAGRTQRAAEPLIGFFVNTLALRIDLSGDPSFLALLDRAREICLAAYAHQDLPFERLVEDLHPARDLSRQPVFQVMFAFQPAPAGRLDLGELTLETLPAPSPTAKFDLSVGLLEGRETLTEKWEYRTDLFDATTIARLRRSYQTLLAGIVAAPERSVAALPLLTAAERAQLLREWNDTQRGVRRQGSEVSDQAAEGACMHALIAAQAARAPDACALMCGERQLSYAALDRRANQLAQHLRALGIGPEAVVGVCMERSPDLAVALLGVLKAGSAYLPLDPSYPAARIKFMLEDSGATVLIIYDLRLTIDHLEESQTTIVHRTSKIVNLRADWPLIAQQPDRPPALPRMAGHLAYIIYTSGSTGSPKGVLVPHRGLSNAIPYCGELFAMGPHSRMLQLASISFDASALELFAALAHGGCAVMPSLSQLDGGAALPQLLDLHRITAMLAMPSFLEALPSGAYPHLHTLAAGGERSSAAAFERWSAGRRMLNLYGPTEATIYAAAWRADGPAPSFVAPVGRPIPNAQVYLLDARMRPVPIGVVGELYIGGFGVARGYRNRPDLTAERFIPNPFAGIDDRRAKSEDSDADAAKMRSAIRDPRSSGGLRLYKTGDLGRCLPDGRIEVLGRADHQIKLRGYRIELGEVEAALQAHPRVRHAAVLLREDAPGDQRLVAYVVPTVEDSGWKIEDSASGPSAALSAALNALSAEFRAFLAERLPEYMLPGAFVALDALPLMPNGKVDRAALPAPDRSLRSAAQEYIAPRTPVERQVADVIAEMLHIERVGRNDDFFTLGGHSLLATRLTLRLRELFDIKLPLRSLFEAQSVAHLAERIETLRWLNQDDRAASALLAGEDELGEI